MLLPTIILSIILMGLVFAGLGLRILLVKGGEFRGTCATNNPYLQKEIGDCQLCGKKAGEDCRKDELGDDKLATA